MTRIIRNLLALFAFVFALGFAVAATAQQYPSRVVRIIVPYVPGGTVDAVARVVADRLSEQMGRQFIVDNRAGANGMLGSEAVAKAAPDGYTLLLQASTFVTNPLFMTNVPYDVVRDFVPVSNIGSVPLLITAHPGVKASNLRQFIDLARAEPGKLSFGTSALGSASHVAEEAIKHDAKLDVLIVPYKGTGAVITDLLGGHVSAFIDALPSSYPLVKAGKVRALGVTSAKRIAMLPDVPTVAESGLPGFDMASWYGLWGPARLPQEVTARLAGEVAKAVRSPLASERLGDQGFMAVGSSPAEFASFITVEMTKLARIIKEANIKAE